MKKLFAKITASVMMLGSVYVAPCFVTACAADSGTMTWKIDTVSAMPGETVTVNIYADENTSVAVAGAQFSISNGNGIVLDSVSDVSEAYGSGIAANISESQFAFADSKGVGNKCSAGDVVMSLTFTVPSNCEEGVYPITWGDNSFMYVSSENGEDITSLIKTVDGAINISSSPVDPGFLIGDVDGNGKIDAMDASAVLTYYVLKPDDNNIGFKFNKKAADWDGNGVIDARDASAILTYYVNH